MGTRSTDKAAVALAEIGNPSDVEPIVIDVGSEESVAGAYQDYLKVRRSDEFIDVFINNAAAQLDWVPNKSHIPTLEIDVELLDKIFRVNVFGAVLTTRYFLSTMRGGGRIVNVASGSGEFWDPNAYKDFQPGYAPSKSALIMMTKKLACAVIDRGIYVNSCCPGWCKTSMGGDTADTSPDDGAGSVIAACFLKTDTPPSGRYFRYGKLIPLDVIPYMFFPPENGCEGRLSAILNSRTWRYGSKITSIVRKIFPKGSIRARIAWKIFSLFKQ